jgi:hypothetical protein
MKMKNYLMVTAILFSAVSCSNDDSGSTPLADQVSAVYAGVSSSTMTYVSAPMINEGDTTVITKVSDNMLSVSYRGQTWGNATFSNATVTENDTSYVIAGSGTITMDAHGTSKNYDATLYGYVLKNKSKKFNLKISIPSVMGGTVISFLPASQFVAADFISKTYAGSVSASFKYSDTPMINDNDSVVVTKNSDNTVNVIYIGQTWGKGVFENIPVTVTTDAYTLEGSGKISMGMSAATVKDYDATFKATLSRTPDGEDTFVFTLASVMGGTVITFTAQ